MGCEQATSVIYEDWLGYATGLAGAMTTRMNENCYLFFKKWATSKPLIQQVE